MSNRLYGTRAWPRLTTEYIRREPTCRTPGCGHRSDQADHAIPRPMADPTSWTASRAAAPVATTPAVGPPRPAPRAARRTAHRETRLTGGRHDPRQPAHWCQGRGGPTGSGATTFGQADAGAPLSAVRVPARSCGGNHGTPGAGGHADSQLPQAARQSPDAGGGCCHQHRASPPGRCLPGRSAACYAELIGMDGTTTPATELTTLWTRHRLATCAWYRLRVPMPGH
jgi:hypothetical protein